MAADIRVARLRRAVSQLLDAARRGECTPEPVELVALHVICSRHGALDSSRAIREYFLERYYLVDVDWQHQDVVAALATWEQAVRR